MNTQTRKQSAPELFRRYLEDKGFSKGTLRTYVNIIETYFQSNPGMDTYNYQDVLVSLERYSGGAMSLNTRKGYLNAIKKYYDYLLDTGQREDHPCTLLNIKGNVKRKIIHSDLFTPEELELLFTKEERFPKQKLRNQVMASLLIYQAIMPNELVRMKVNHINLDEGTIFLLGGRMLTQRTLPLRPNQYGILDKYLHKGRRKMAAQKTDYLLLNYQGLPCKEENISFFVEWFKPMFPGKNINCKTVRDSVISNWLNVNRIPLDQVQLLAGHRWISSTERYIQVAYEEQREVLKKIHPLG
jgi:site-specific recombinase XerD